jgi:cbb3-type cytochrome oxidase maturation protein
MLVLGLVAVVVLFWAARSGQCDDLEGDAHRILMDDDSPDRRRFPDADEESPRSEPPKTGSGQADSRRES